MMGTYPNAFISKGAVTALCRLTAAACEQVKLGVLAVNLICHPVEAYSALDSLASIFPEKAQARGFGHSSGLRVADAYLPLAGPPPAAPPSSSKSLSRLHIFLRMSSLPALRGTATGILRRPSARIAEYFYQRLAPAIAAPHVAEVIPSGGIAARLARDMAHQDYGGVGSYRTAAREGVFPSLIDERVSWTLY
jgi:hypothetical protein